MGRDLNVKIGSVSREIIIDPVAFEMNLTYDQLRKVQRSQSIIYAEDMEEIELDELVSNWFLRRKDGVRATGEVVFFISSPPATTIQIPAGTIVIKPASEGNAAVRFRTTRTANLTAKDVYPQSSSVPGADTGYLDVDLGAYGVAALVEAVDVGSSGNVDAGTITQMGVGLTGLRVINKSKTDNGFDKESNISLAARQRQALTGISIGTQNGYEVRIKQNVSEVLDIYTVGPKHEMMLRDGGYGGKADFYIMARPFKTTQRQQIGVKIVGTDSPYGEDIILMEQPVMSIISIELLYNGVSVPQNLGGPVFLRPAQMITYNVPAPILNSAAPVQIISAGVGDYVVVKDAGNFAGSIYGQDMIRFTSAIGTGSNESLGITYEVNSTVVSSQNYLELNRGMTDDVLCKEAKERRVQVSCTVDIYSGFDPVGVKNSISDMIISSFNRTGPGVVIQQSDIVDIIREEQGVDNIILPLDQLSFIEDSIIPGISEEIIIRRDDTSVILKNQPVSRITSIEWLNAKGTVIKKLKQDNDVIFVEREDIMANSIPQNEAVALAIMPASSEEAPPDNKVKEFYLAHGRLRTSSGKAVIPTDLIVEGTTSRITEIISETTITVENKPRVVAKITFNSPPTSTELLNGVRISYFYDDGRLPDYRLIKDNSDNGFTFVAEDYIQWLKTFDITLGSQVLRINYEYTILNRGDIQLSPYEFASIRSSDITVKIRGTNPVPSSMKKSISPETELGEI